MHSCPRRPSWALLAGVGRDRGHHPLDDRKWKGKEEGLRRHRKERRISKINHNFLTISRKARAAGLPQICPFYRCKSENAKRVHHFMPLSSVEREMTTPTFIPSESIAILTFNFSDAGCQISSPRKSLRTTKRHREEQNLSPQSHFRGPPQAPRRNMALGCHMSARPQPSGHFQLCVPFTQQSRGLRSALVS